MRIRRKKKELNTRLKIQFSSVQSLSRIGLFEPNNLVQNYFHIFGYVFVIVGLPS